MKKLFQLVDLMKVMIIHKVFLKLKLWKWKILFLLIKILNYYLVEVKVLFGMKNNFILNNLDGEDINVNFNCFNNIYVYTFKTSEFRQYANSTSKN